MLLSLQILDEVLFLQVPLLLDCKVVLNAVLNFSRIYNVVHVVKSVISGGLAQH